MAASQRPAEILCVGFGALGVLYSWVLEQSGGARVTAVCRSNYDSVKEVGVDIISAKFGHHLGYKPYRVVKNAEEAKDRVYDCELSWLVSRGSEMGPCFG